MPDPCHRCLQPVPAGARRCPHCGDMLHAGARKVSLTLGVIGLVILVAIMAFGLYIASTNQENTDDQDGQTTSTPAPPPKKPPLN